MEILRREKIKEILNNPDYPKFRTGQNLSYVWNRSKNFWQSLYTVLAMIEA